MPARLWTPTLRPTLDRGEDQGTPLRAATAAEFLGALDLHLDPPKLHALDLAREDEGELALPVVREIEDLVVEGNVLGLEGDQAQGETSDG